MLKNIDPVLTGSLLKALDELGHGQKIALVDRNYPSHSSGAQVIHLGEIGIVRAAEAVFGVFPLDSFIESRCPEWKQMISRLRPRLTTRSSRWHPRVTLHDWSLKSSPEWTFIPRPRNARSSSSAWRRLPTLVSLPKKVWCDWGAGLTPNIGASRCRRAH